MRTLCLLVLIYKCHENKVIARSGVGVKVDVNGDRVLDAREVTFRIPNGVKVYGGFNGTELTRDQRDWQTNITVLSGDIDNNDKLTNGIVSYVDDIVGANAYHVIYTSNVGPATRVDGFVINAGHEYFDNFIWDGPAQFADYGDYGTVTGTIVDLGNRGISFDVYLKLVEPKTWAEWSRMGRSWLVHIE